MPLWLNLFICSFSELASYGSDAVFKHFLPV